MPHAKSLAISLLVALGFASSGHADEPTQAQVEWLQRNAIPITTVVAGGDRADLKPLRDAIGDARIVALGEGTHGTREFFQMKHRLVEFLARDMGFTIFSIEASMPEAYRLNDYVLRGEGDPRELIGGMYFWTWNTEEVLALVEWMRACNAAGDGRIEFTGFDMQTPDVAMQIVRDYVTQVDASAGDEIQTAYENALRSQPRGRRAFAVATGSFPVDAAAGKHIRYTGYIRTQDVADGFAGLWWRIDGKSGVLGFDNMHDRGPHGTTDWTHYTIELDVDQNATNINFGALLAGSGTAWFDGLEVTIDGTPFDAGERFDGSFEGDTVRGFFTRGAGYDIEIVTDTAQRGDASLRMRKRPAAADTPDTAVAVAACRRVVAQLERQRGAYIEASSKSSFEWALQNARVVLQCMQMRDGAVSRDESMARNVAWILEQAPPKTRIILWAHNGHVRQDAPDNRYRPMGSFLRRQFGDDYVAVGFASRTGCYTAIRKGDGLQSDNDLLPPPAGSAEHILQQPGMPIFMVDLRRGSANHPGSAWLNQPTEFRSIGALAMSERQFSPIQLRAAFDLLVYIDETTPTRPLSKAK
jgi:erythromycin esterase-like protein